jgi:hypothetical protein
MWDALFNLLERYATWPVVTLLFALFLLCQLGFQMRGKALGLGTQTLDVRFGYSPEEARDFFQSIGERGRKIYGWTQLTLDILFPLVYGALYAMLIIHVYPRETARYLTLVPALNTVSDLLENVTNAYLSLQFDGRASPLTRGASIFTMVKIVLLALSLMLILIGAVWSLWRSYRSPA